MVTMAHNASQKPGYKQTEVGVIPEDWEVKKLGSLGRVIRGASPRPQGDKRYYGGSIPRLMVEDVTRDGKYVTPKIDFLTNEGAKRSRLCKKGTLTIVCSGTVGIPSFLSVDACIHDGFLALIDIKKNVSEDYLYHQLTILKNKFEISATHGGVFTNLTTSVLNNFQIPLPLSPEQTAIATALSDVDALIASLDKLIAKKRNIKQATMQQLLTGKRRLPGFRGEWEVKKLGTLLKFQVGFPFSSIFFNQKDNGIRIIKNRDIKSDDQIYHYSGEYSPAYLVVNGDVLVGMDGDFISCLWSKGPALLNQRVGRILTSLDIDRTFTFYSLSKPLKAIEIVTSSTTVKHLSHGDIENIEMPIPHLEEQQAIAIVLSDMDAEIVALERRRDKTRALKQGMMQELLTGKTRLI